MKQFKIKAFTLAEALIALGVIGIVAALTLPVLITTISNKITENQIAVFERKLSKGTDLLNINNGIGPYYNDTESFIKKLSEHLKIVTICGKNNLKKCLPYESIQQEGAEPFEVDDISTNAFTGIDKTQYLDAGGFVLADGTPMILTFKKDCPISDPDVPSNKKTGSTTSCIAGFYDLNGAKGPNKFNKDIVPFGITGLKDGIKFAGLTLLSGPHVPTTILKTEDICTNNNGTWTVKSEYSSYIPNCCSSCTSSGDYWASAMIECKKAGGHLATEKELATIATYIFDAPTPIEDRGKYIGNLNTSKLGTVFAGLGSSWFSLWASSEPSSSRALGRNYYAQAMVTVFTDPQEPQYLPYRYDSNFRAVCVAD